jgi:hypothetical protein
LWDGRDAEGFTTLAAVQGRLAQKAQAGSPVPAADPS